MTPLRCEEQINHASYLLQLFVNNCNKIITWWSFNDVSNFVPQEASVAKWGWSFEKTKDSVYENITITSLLSDITYSNEVWS